MSNLRGFTLVEVVVALFLLSVGMLSVFSIFASATRTFTEGHASVEVAAIAASVLERKRAAGCGDMSAGSWIGSAITYTWETDEVAAQLQRVTVIVVSAAARARVDTFSAMITC